MQTGMHEPLDTVVARAAVRRILERGVVSFTRHALEAMRDDRLEQVDVLAVLRGGRVEGPEWESGAWRYRVCTARAVVGVELEYGDEEEAEEAGESTVVTVWSVR